MRSGIVVRPTSGTTRSSPHRPAAPFRRALLAWYRANARDLPFRHTADPYAVWLSEIVLQQTRVDQGLPYYERFIAAFPDVHALAAAHEDRVLKLWEGLGYFPRTAAELETLPGIGRYTAGAIASIAFGERVPVLDGNVIRVLSRVYNVAECTDDASVRERLWGMAAGLVPAKRPGDFNQAMMELGARVCTPRTPACTECPVRQFCAARACRAESERPVRTRKVPARHREMVAAVVLRNGRYLLLKRPSAGLLGGLWEFPCGDVHRGETHPKALERVLREQLGVGASVGGAVARVRHAYTHFKVTLHVYACAIIDGTPAVTTHDALRWTARTKLRALALPKVVHKFVDML